MTSSAPQDWAPAALAATVAALLLSPSRVATLWSGRHWRWNLIHLRGLPGMTALGASLTESPLFDLLPDYLLLLFFGVWLYYSERLAFFDVFLKEGVYFAAGSRRSWLASSPGPSRRSHQALISPTRPLARWTARPSPAQRLGGSPCAAAQVLAHGCRACVRHSDSSRQRRNSPARGGRAKPARSFSLPRRSLVPNRGRPNAVKPGGVTLPLERTEGQIRLRARQNQVAYLE